MKRLMIVAVIAICSMTAQAQESANYTTAFGVKFYRFGNV